MVIADLGDYLVIKQCKLCRKQAIPISGEYCNICYKELITNGILKTLR